MNNQENEKEVLDELNKGSCMGMDAIHYILSKVEDNNLRDELENQYEKYKSISSRVRNIYKKYGEGKPDETSTMNKTMTFYGIQMNTIKDSSSSKISEILLQGTNMGIIKGRKLLNNSKVSGEVKKLLKEYVDMQEDAAEILKSFL